MKALSVRQPYAWAILDGHKPIENRTFQTHLRGDIAIHAPREPHRLGFEDILVHEAWERTHPRGSLLRDHGELAYGAVLGVVRITATHVAEGTCCAPWGQHGHRVRHWMVRDPVWLDEPIACRGALSLWDLPDDVEARVRAQLPPRH